MIRSTLAAVRAARLGSSFCFPASPWLCAWAYWPTLGTMAGKWLHEPQYAHGYLVPLFSLFLLWRRRAMLAAAPAAANWWGVLPVLLGCRPAGGGGLPLLRLAGRRLSAALPRRSLRSPRRPARAAVGVAGDRLPVLHDPSAVPGRDGVRAANCSPSPLSAAPTRCKPSACPPSRRGTSSCCPTAGSASPRRAAA